MATATTLSPLGAEGMEGNAMETGLQPESSHGSDLLIPEPSNAPDSQPSSRETNEYTEDRDGITIESPTSTSTSLEVTQNSANLENYTDTGLASDDTPEDTAADAAAETAEGEGDEDESADLKIPFEPGDHITRWEMLPIAWPIQVHGIVLEVHEDAVVLVDFGLAAVPEGKNKKKNRKRRGLFGRRQKQPEEAVEENESPSNKVAEEAEKGQEGGGEAENKDASADAKEEEEKKQQQHVKKAIENFQKGFKKERNRLNVQTLTTKKEISKWSKVNYDGGLFGFGNKDGEASNDNGGNEEQSKSSSPKRLEKRESWWGSLMKNQEKKKTEREQRKKEKDADNNTTDDSNNQSSDDTIATSPKSDSEPLKIADSVDSAATPTSVPGCGGMPGCAESTGTPWWCRISMQRGKKRGDKDVTAAAMLEASKSGDLVQEYKKKNRWEDDGEDILGELEKQQMRKSLQQQHSNYVASSMPDGVAASDSNSSMAEADEKKMEDTEGTDTEGTDGSPKSEIVPTDEIETPFEEEKKDEHEVVSDSSPDSKDKESPQLSVITDGGMLQAEATSLESPDATSQASKRSPEHAASPSSNAEESLESSDSLSTKSELDSSSPNKKHKHVSKADPAVVVLARTRWLLKHGEGILPPYHAFSSNSECIAVFCKTGYWSTLQADIFLHSTAIGNAKSATLSTLAVAASVPMLAPVVGVVGLGAVVAPWFYLDKQKKAARETQQRLADMFWAQAEPDVILACVKEWSNLGEHDDKSLEETTGEDNAEETLLTVVDEAGATGESSD